MLAGPAAGSCDGGDEPPGSVFVLGEPVRAGVERHGEGFLGAEDVDEARPGAGVDEEFHVADPTLKLRDGRVAQDGGVDFAMLHGGHRSCGDADTGDGDVVGGHPVLVQQVVEEDVRRRPRGTDADSCAFEVGNLRDGPSRGRGHGEDRSRGGHGGDEGSEGLPLDGHGDGVPDVAAGGLGVPREEALHGVRPGSDVDDCHVEAFVGVVAQLVGEDHGQVEELARSGDGQGDLRGLSPARLVAVGRRRASGEEGGRQSAGEESGASRSG